MDSSLLDTDVLSEILRGRNAVVTKHAAQYLMEHSEFALSAITHYEIVRGLLHRNAIHRLALYRKFVSRALVLPVNETILEQAANLWVDGERSGRPHGDADLIIAATAMTSGRTPVTGNIQHFDWIAGLTIANWREP